MKTIESETTDKTHAYAPTGNEPRDLRILQAIAEKYNHNKTSNNN